MWIACCIAIPAICLCAPAANASGASILVEVVNSQGRPISGARVRIFDQPDGNQLDFGATDARGAWRSAKVGKPPTKILVTVDAFDTAKIKPVDVDSDQETSVRIKIDPQIARAPELGPQGSPVVVTSGPQLAPISTCDCQPAFQTSIIEWRQPAVYVIPQFQQPIYCSPAPSYYIAPPCGCSPIGR
jgi:hypothetical protein